MFKRYWKFVNTAFYLDPTPENLKFIFRSTEIKIMQAVDEVLTKLDPLESDILVCKFGLNCDSLTDEEIALIHNFSKSKVRDIELKALKKISNTTIGYVLHKCLGNAGLCDMPHLSKNPEYLMKLKDKVASGNKLSEAELSTIVLYELPLDVRCISALICNEINTPLELRKRTKTSLMQIPNLGMKSIRQLEQVMAEFGVELQK